MKGFYDVDVKKHGVYNDHGECVKFAVCIPECAYAGVRYQPENGSFVVPSQHWSIEQQNMPFCGNDAGITRPRTPPHAHTRLHAHATTRTCAPGPDRKKLLRQIPVEPLESLKAPFITCVAMDRTGGDFERNVVQSGFVEGVDWFPFG